MLFGRKQNQKPSLRAEAVMPGRRSLLAMGCACCAIALVPRGAARAAPAVVQQHLELARQAAGST